MTHFCPPVANVVVARVWEGHGVVTQNVTKNVTQTVTEKEVSSDMYLIAKCRHYRISEVCRGDKVKYVIHRRRLGWLWLRQWVPSIFFDFPVNWLRSVSVDDTVDDAQDALYSHLWMRHPSSDYTLHVWQSRWLRG